MPASSFLEFCVNAAFVVTAGVHLWQQLRRAQELYERSEGGAWNGGGGGGGGNGGRPRRVVMTTPQGERILVLASDEALREMGFLPEQEEEAEEEVGAEEAARRVLLRIPGGGGARGGREFGPDDYEALSSLDEGLRPARAAPVSQELLDMLPTHEHHSRRKNAEVASSSSHSSAQGGEGGGGDDKKGSSSSSFDTCSVCLQDFEEGETVRTLPCLHHFHLYCVDPWLKQRGRNLAACPVCKTTVFS